MPGPRRKRNESQCFFFLVRHIVYCDKYNERMPKGRGRRACVLQECSDLQRRSLLICSRSLLICSVCVITHIRCRSDNAHMRCRSDSAPCTWVARPCHERKSSVKPSFSKRPVRTVRRSATLRRPAHPALLEALIEATRSAKKACCSAARLCAASSSMPLHLFRHPVTHPSPRPATPSPADPI